MKISNLQLMHVCTNSITGREPFKCIKVPIDVKLNEEHYDLALKVIFEQRLPKIYTEKEKRKKCSFMREGQLTHLENCEYLKDASERHDIQYQNKKYIPAKGADIGSMHFYRFGYIKNKYKCLELESLDDTWKDDRGYGIVYLLVQQIK